MMSWLDISLMVAVVLLGFISVVLFLSTVMRPTRWADRKLAH